MILRLSQKLAKKLKAASSIDLPLDPNPFVDWSAHLFTAERIQYVIVTNTASLYSMVTYGRGLSSEYELLDRAMTCIRELMIDDGLEFIYSRFITPSMEPVRFSKALNRSVIGSMNDLVFHAKVWLTEGKLSTHKTTFKLNDIPMSPLDYRKPREAFKSLIVTRQC